MPYFTKTYFTYILDLNKITKVLGRISNKSPFLNIQPHPLLLFRLY